MSKYILRIIGSGDFQKNAAKIIKEVAKSEKESIVVTRNNPQIVIMSIDRYEKLKAIENLEFIPHIKTSPQQISESFKNTGLYSDDFIADMEDGIKKSSLYQSS
ncbi:type II toxin-antitoxin system Phd/YefM family antitoxin [Candidatus Peregrinibacteria bacterium]|nr:type II toxin-antitoxin system Phd/YefM family antitoxin [Candidatus Peregrinibacteria bacterium]